MKTASVELPDGMPIGERPEGKKPNFEGTAPPKRPNGNFEKEPPKFNGEAPNGARPNREIPIDESKLSDILEIKKGQNTFIVK